MDLSETLLYTGLNFKKSVMIDDVTNGRYKSSFRRWVSGDSDGKRMATEPFEDVLIGVFELLCETRRVVQ